MDKKLKNEIKLLVQNAISNSSSIFSLKVEVLSKKVQELNAVVKTYELEETKEIIDNLKDEIIEYNKTLDVYLDANNGLSLLISKYKEETSGLKEEIIELKKELSTQLNVISAKTDKKEFVIMADVQDAITKNVIAELHSM